MTHFILGSQSPRRKEILSFFNLSFEQIPSAYDEDELPFENNPQEYVKMLSKGKALDLHQKHPGATILTADTIVYRAGKVYGKPSDREDAIRGLLSLQGQWHSVFTALSLIHEERCFDQLEETRVLFNPLTPHEINLYVDQHQWADKAGGYAIQMAGGLIVRKIDGCYYNVMGMPINALRTLLLPIGIDLWERMG